MKSVVASLLTVAVCASSVMAQTWTYGFRIVMDGRLPSDAGSTGAAPLFPYTQAHQDAGTTPTRIGFWLQARVSQTGGQNYGIGRFSSGSPSSPDATSFIRLNDSVASSHLSRGAVNAAATQRGRVNPFRSGGTTTAEANSERDNPSGVLPFPDTTNAQNGAFDQDGDRLYGIDAFVGASRPGVEDPDLGEFANPWTILAPSNEFSPWQNIYRFCLDFADTTTLRSFSMLAQGQLFGTVGTQQVGSDYPMELSPTGTTVYARFEIGHIPSPGAGAVLGLGMIAATNRRR